MKTAEQHEQEMQNKYKKGADSGGGAKITSIVCPHYYDQPCKVCDLTYGYYQLRLGKEHYLRQKAHDLNRKIRYYSNVLFPANPSEVVLFEYGDVIHRMLYSFFSDDDSEYKGFTDPVNGRNCVIKKTVPGGNKRLTDYFVEMKAQISQIPNPAVLSSLHNLDKVVELIETGKVKPYYQSQLTDGRTELRILPSWLGPKFKVFYVEVPYHYITKEEFDSITNGKTNPFADVGVGTKVQRQPDPIIVTPSNPGNPWEGIFSEAPKHNPNAPTPSYDMQEPMAASQTTVPQDVEDPICIGSFDVNSPLCTSRCATLGFLDKCKRTTAMKSVPSEADQKAIRETAARLYK